jgi:hypothetical protein
MYHLIYKSKPVEAANQELLLSIFGASQKKNKELNITGLLLATDKHFIQILEGEKGAVNRLYHDIAKDGRHGDLELVSFQPIEKRSFPEWTMKIIRFDDLHKGIRESIIQKYGSSNQDFCIPEKPELAFSLLYDVYAMTK